MHFIFARLVELNLERSLSKADYPYHLNELYVYGYYRTVTPADGPGCDLISGVKSKVDSLRSKWTVNWGLTRQFKRQIADGHISKCTVCEIGRSEMKKLDGPNE